MSEYVPFNEMTIEQLKKRGAECYASAISDLQKNAERLANFEGPSALINVQILAREAVALRAHRMACECDNYQKREDWAEAIIDCRIGYEHARLDAKYADRTIPEEWTLFQKYAFFHDLEAQEQKECA